MRMVGAVWERASERISPLSVAASAENASSARGMIRGWHITVQMQFHFVTKLDLL